ncbi:hypothetical protein SLS60_005727 [Paraconiothyrium brasiliense]|uniref:Amidase domain-containing protein n=1 Tax=Paraconiothyrium brasiliense TaxID=300254 RepID=A0ABR3RI71_9PLEO
MQPSVRIPASYCGLVGFKATWGLVPYSGILSLHADIDHCGPMTRSVRDNAALLEAIAGPDGFDDRQPYTMIPETLKYTKHLDEFLAASKNSSKPLESFKIGVLKEGFEMSLLDPSVDKAVRSAIDDLKSLGAEVTEVSIPEHKKICGAWTCVQALAGSRDGLLGDQTGRKGLQMTDRAQSYEPSLSQERFDSLGAGAKNLYMKHLYVMEKYGVLVHAKATNVIRRQCRAYDAVLGSLDALVMPTIPFPAPRIFLEDETASPLQRLLRVAGTVLNTAPFNATGHPALTLPVGFVSAQDNAKIKLPTGLQIVGKHFGESTCLKIAAAWERSKEWKKFDY